MQLPELSETVATRLSLEGQEERRHTDQYARSESSQTSYASTFLTGGSLSIPRPPQDSLGEKPFECPHCYYIVTLANTRSWTKHVFLDLKPYICVAEDCTTPHKLYGTQREWTQHLTSAHASAWIRPEPGEVGGKTQAGKDLSCLLCTQAQDSQHHYERHLARHLQDLALFVLPRQGENFDEDDSELGSQELDNVGSWGGSFEESEVNTMDHNDSDVSPQPENDRQVDSADEDKHWTEVDKFQGSTKNLEGAVDALEPPSLEHPPVSPARGSRNYDRPMLLN